jgi:uncharacterized protein (TIGR02145 family)
MKTIILLAVALIYIGLEGLKAQTVTDYDGDVYNTVTIGTQIWMAANLKTTHYADGTAIAKVTDNTTWSNLITGAYCWYNNDSATYENLYGKLYNWYTVVDSRNLCPTGWHVPSDAEWTTLTTYLGGERVAGGKLKETGTAHWVSPNTGATNETGFAALPGGIRVDGGTFYYVGLSGSWWSSTESSSDDAWYRAMHYHLRFVHSSSPNELHGFSVRCLRD